MTNRIKGCVYDERERAKMIFFFFNDTATTEIYTLSLHDALPIWLEHGPHGPVDELVHPTPLGAVVVRGHGVRRLSLRGDWKSTRLNSSHANISYAVFCLKKKKQYLSTLTITSAYTFLTCLIYIYR